MPPPSAQPSYAALTQDQLTMLREHALSWLCHDKGLVDFLYPSHPDTPSVSPEQRRAHAKAVVQAMLSTHTEAGRAATARTFTREAAACLRRMTARLADGSFTHRDVAKISVLLEGLWDDVNTPLSDRVWARCSMRFDTALITLRVTYLLAYLDTEVPSASHPPIVRKAVFQDLVRRFFSPDAPTDDSPEKHSSGFKLLRDAWRSELINYAQDDAFDDKIQNLAKIQPPAETGKYVLGFMKELSVDHSWLLDALKLESDVRSGALVKADEAVEGEKPRRRGRPAKKNGQRKKKTTEGATKPSTRTLYQADEPDSSSSSSFEPAMHDSDYDVEGDRQVNDDEEDDDDENAEVDSPETRRLRRSRRQRDNDMVRRSLGVARAGVKRSKKRTRKGPERFSELEYPTGNSVTPDDKLATRKSRKQIAESMSELVDNEPGYDVEMEDEAGEVAQAGKAVATRRSRRLLRTEDDDVPLRESKASEEVRRLSERLDPDSQTFESTGYSDVDEHVAEIVRRRRLSRALAKVNLRERAGNDDDE